MTGSKSGEVGPHEPFEDLFAEVLIAVVEFLQPRNESLNGMMTMRAKTFKEK